MSAFKQIGENIEFSTNTLKVSLSTKDGRVVSLTNLIDGKEILRSKPDVPWFSYILLEDETIIKPKSLSLNRENIRFVYDNDAWAEFSVEIFDKYFTLTLADSDIPETCASLAFGVLSAEYYWAMNDEKSYALSLVTMTTSAIVNMYPAASNKETFARVPTDVGINYKNAKVAITFSYFGEQREVLKRVVDAIDPRYGLANTNGGPYILDSENAFGDYVISSGGITPDTAEETGRILQGLSVDQINYHQGTNTFIQGDFNFVGSRTEEEKANDTFIPPSVFKERIADKVAKYGVHFSLHTYSSLIDSRAHSILANPKWQKQLCYEKITYTLKNDVDAECTAVLTAENAGNFEITPYRNMPRGNAHSAYIIIDEEIIRIMKNDETGFTEVMRAQCGTKAVPHKKGSTIKQLLGWYGMFQSKPLSELFYYVAEQTAHAYNEGGFRMIYLDGFESLMKSAQFSDPRIRHYAYAEFVRTILLHCKIPPLMEFSTMVCSLWAARGRWRAVDVAITQYKRFKLNHMQTQKACLKFFYTATLGWFNTAPDAPRELKNTVAKTMFRDDLDQMGSFGIAYNFGTVYHRYSPENYNAPTKLYDNAYYYNTYSRLRKANYFAPEVREAIKDENYEYKVFKQDDGTWAMKQMRYFKNRIYDMADDTFITGKANNVFKAQTPFVRIEQRYSTLSEDEKLLLSIDETKPITDAAHVHKIEEINISKNQVLKVKVCGNGGNGAILITLRSPDEASDARHDFYIPLNFKGWREFVLVDNDNGDTDGHEFEGIDTSDIVFECYRSTAALHRIHSVQISVDGDVEGVKIGDIRCYKLVDAPSKNPSVTIGDSNITFKTELHSGEFVEYYPEFNKAYYNYYEFTYDDDGNYKSDRALIREIDFEGTLALPEGEFEYTYDAEPLTDAPLRALVAIGASGKVFANPADWKAPEVDVDKYYEVRLRK